MRIPSAAIQRPAKAGRVQPDHFGAQLCGIEGMHRRVAGGFGGLVSRRVGLYDAVAKNGAQSEQQGCAS
jgi:hypothetical protein